MGIVLSSSGNDVHVSLCLKTVGNLEARIIAAFDNWKQQRDAWRGFHHTAIGRHVPRRAWMRHGAMLEVISQKNGETANR
jgi:hypothetical protein